MKRCEHIWEDGWGDNHECGKAAFHSGPHRCATCCDAIGQDHTDGSL